MRILHVLLSLQPKLVFEARGIPEGEQRNTEACPKRQTQLPPDPTLRDAVDLGNPCLLLNERATVQRLHFFRDTNHGLPLRARSSAAAGGARQSASDWYRPPGRPTSWPGTRRFRAEDVRRARAPAASRAQVTYCLQCLIDRAIGGLQLLTVGACRILVSGRAARRARTPSR